MPAFPTNLPPPPQDHHFSRTTSTDSTTSSQPSTLTRRKAPPIPTSKPNANKIRPPSIAHNGQIRPQPPQPPPNRHQPRQLPPPPGRHSTGLSHSTGNLAHSGATRNDYTSFTLPTKTVNASMSSFKSKFVFDDINNLPPPERFSAQQQSAKRTPISQISNTRALQKINQ